MLTKIEFLLEFDRIVDCAQLTVSDRDSEFCNISHIENLDVCITHQIRMPNQITFTVGNITNGQNIRLKKFFLGGIELSQSVINQICQVKTNDNTFVMPHWYHNGTVTIDLFAPDFIQYHLLYGNLIKKTVNDPY